MISKGSRLGVGSLIRGMVSYGLKTISGVPRLNFYEQNKSIELKRLLKDSFYTTSKREHLRKNQHNDTTALQSLLRGAEEGLNYFFQQYYTPLTYFATCITEDRLFAEEIAAESFVKLWNSREKINEHGSIKSWLYTSVRNSCIDHIRKVKRLKVNQQGLQTSEIIEQSVLHKMIETETIDRIFKSLQGLPPKCRQVFRMFYFQGKSHEEIAKELQISAHTVRNQKLRAVRLLKEMIHLLLFFLLYQLWL
jgi:RNA polymerase sigma-70 factor (family 1)